MKHPALALVAISAAWAIPAAAHIELTYPTPRYVYDPITKGSVQKVGPCGDPVGGTPTGTVTPLQGGDEITVTWTEVINHPGHFRIALDQNQNGSDEFTYPVDQFDKNVTGNIIAYIDDNGGSDFQYTFTLPNIDCPNCVLQVVQVMTDKVNPTWGDNDLYFWCADIAITKSNGQGGGGGTGGSTSSGTGGAGGMGSASGGNGGGGNGTAATSSSGGGNFPTNDDEGCTVTAAGQQARGGWWVLALASAWWIRRKRR